MPKVKKKPTKVVGNSQGACCDQCGNALSCRSCANRRAAKIMHKRNPNLARDAGRRGGRPSKRCAVHDQPARVCSELNQLCQSALDYKKVVATV